MTLGKIWLDNSWKIQAQPHVILKLKRLFPKIDKTQHGTISVSNIPEVCRDLEWFLDRYPLEMERGHRELLTGQSIKQKQLEKYVQDLVTGEIDPRVFDLKLPPRDYQRIASDLCLKNGGLLVADDLGLGKTLIGICVASVARPSLIVTLSHLPGQWKNEFKKFAPHLTTHVLRSATPYKFKLTDVIITNYHKLNGWADVLGDRINSIVFDEVQELRRDESAKSSAARYLTSKTDYAIGLSATPIYNYGDEMFNIMETLKAGCLGTRSEFLQEWCVSSGNGKYIIQNPEAFGTYLRNAGLMLRRTRADVGRELPPLTRIVHKIEVDTKHLDSIQSAATELSKIILGVGGARGEKFKASEELSMLVRQATGVAKAPYVADFARMILSSEEKVVIFGWHRAVYDIWMERLRDFHPVMYTGSETSKQKEESKQAFVHGNSRVMLMSLRAGAGLDGLQKVCRTPIYGELDWSPGVHEQNDGRFSRDDLLGPVFSYFLLADSGSDPIVADVLGLKTGQIAGIRDPGKNIIQKLQIDPNHIRKLAEAYMKKGGQ